MNNKNIKISGRSIGRGMPSFIIAEIAQAHDGSLGFAHSYIDAVASTGADAIKFQTHIASAESTKDEPFRVNFSYQDSNRYDYWKRMEFTFEQWEGLAEHCRELGLMFLSSAFSVEAVELLDKLNMPAWKVGSGEVNNPLILSAMMETNKPLLLSSGMSGWDEINKAVETIIDNEKPLALFQCTSKYPTALQDVGLNVLSEMKHRFDIPIGLSDHSGSIYPSLAALGQGVELLEVHVVHSKKMFGPDTKSSITIEELAMLCEARNAFYEMESNPVDKDKMSIELHSLRKLFNKSVALKDSFPAGTILEKSMLTTKKPGTGIPAEKIEECIGKELKTDKTVDSVLDWKDMGLIDGK